MSFSGSYVAIVTPMRDGGFDAEAFDRLIEFHIDGGTKGIIPCGTTGEAATLSVEEQREVILRAVETAKGRIEVIAGTGANSTTKTIELTRNAKEAGASGALIITPYYNKPTQAGLEAHYRSVAEAVDLPIIVYNCPGRTACSINPETLASLAEVPNIVAIKDATANLNWTTEVMNACDLTILSGDDALTLPHMALGARGIISVSANILPAEVAALCKLIDESQWAKARKLHQDLYPITKLLFIESSPIPVKAALHAMGKIGPEIRGPLSPMSEANFELLKAEMIRMKLLPES